MAITERKKRTTNADKWDALLNILQKRESSFFRSLFNDCIPEKIYHVNRLGSVEERSVKNVTYKHPPNILYFHGKTPSKGELSTLESYTSSDEAMLPEKVIIHWKGPLGDKYTISGATSFIDLVRNEWDFSSEEEANAKASEIAALREEEKQLLASGCIRCRYCGAIREPAHIVYEKIWSPSYRGGRSDPRPYCKDKGCARYDQMGHEG